MRTAISGQQANLDLVRAVAVLMVVVSHLSWFLGDIHFSFLEPALYGRLGVVIFFVHSGIVNMLSIERHAETQGSRRLFWAYITRRCFRIYPLSVFVVSVVFLTGIPVSHLGIRTLAAAGQPRAELFPSLLLVQNFFQFDQLLGPLWSLPYEIQIYCLFPAIYLLLRRFRSAKVLITAWALLAAMQHVISPRLLKHGTISTTLVIPDMLFYFLWFLAGLYAYKEMRTCERRAPFWTLPGLLLFLTIICSLSYDQTRFIFISLCLGLALPHIQDCEIKLLNQCTSWVAKYSYGIYLLHDPAIWLAFVRCAHLPLVVRLSAFLLVTFGGSVLLYHVLEYPMIRVGNRLAGFISRAPRPVLKAQAAAV